ncbi:MAG: hypothetical protein Q4E62_08000, partial [Sutterellaceae bacterium]|nr:hypothetical protein [Sutterellaceae bacterium]
VVESGFSGNSPARGAEITVRPSENGPVLLTGKTNDKGIFRFAVAKDWNINEGLVVTVNAGEGHRNTWTVAPDELKIAFDSATSESQLQDETVATAMMPPETVSATKTGETPPQTVTVTKEELEAIVACALARQLAPIEKRLAESVNPPIRLTDIVGGIGWLVGLGGIAAYFARREKDNGKRSR